MKLTEDQKQFLHERLEELEKDYNNSRSGLRQSIIKGRIKEVMYLLENKKELK